MSNTDILKRLFNVYTKKYIPKIFIALFFTLILAGSTSSIAYLLDPAIEKLFIEKDQKLKMFFFLSFILLFKEKFSLFISNIKSSLYFFIIRPNLPWLIGVGIISI